MITLAVLAGAAFVGAGIATGPATASGRDTRLTITVRPAAGHAKAAWLTCDPAGGSHRRAAAACGTLQAASGDPSAIVVADGFCTMQYAPVTATVRGRWQGRAVRYRQTFSNDCVLRQATGELFRL